LKRLRVQRADKGGERAAGMASGQTGQSSRYLYERLGDTRFQELCGALLAHSFPDVTCYPVGQSDGGRDIVRKHDCRAFVYQVKWTNKQLQNPVSWLDNAIKGEADNIRRLVQAGADEYYLMTSVAGTASRDRGTMDRLDKLLAAHSKDFGISMQCWWRADIDARVDTAPRELKWTYQEMLAGVDAVRYLIEADSLAAQDQELRTLLVKVLATQWQEDAKVKFKQVELESHDLTDLFVDIEATRLAQPRRAAQLVMSGQTPEAVGGAAKYLLSAKQPLTLVRGEPGQGKSTLGQYLCQVHRAQFLPNDAYRSGAQPSTAITNPRLPLRADLRDYATWLTGADPFAIVNEEPSKKRKHRERKQGSIELFLAEFLQARSGGLSATVETVRDILHRFPILVVLDGLDEVAQERIRNRVVKEIDEFAARLGTSLSAPQLIVTTRPNASGMAEPSSDTFETIALSRLSSSLRTTYLRKWADARSIRGKDRRELERIFRQRSAEPHIMQLADNPMQLTILLYLMQKRGNSVPSARTELYSSYMETLLDREAAKTAAVDEYREDLEEVTSYLGWHLQSIAETTAANGQLTTKALRKAILDYLFGVEKNTGLVDALFTAVTDRVWALTSKVQGTFEFDVQPLREYFAARFLNDFAGADLRDFDTSTVLRHLVRRAYWLNTGRFYAGFAKPNELAGLVEGLAVELEDGTRPLQARLAAWTLLADGVFSARTRTQRSAAELFGDDLSIRLLAHSMTSDPETPRLAPDRGGRQYVALLQEQLVAEPDSPLAQERVAIMTRLLDRHEFDAWWQPQISDATGAAQQMAWLQLGSSVQAASRLEDSDIKQLDLSGNRAAALAVGAGVVSVSESGLEERMVRAVLDGQCSDSQGATPGTAGDLLRLLAPQHHLRRASEERQAYRVSVGHLDAAVPDHQRQSAMMRLKAHDNRFEQLQRALRFNKGQGGTTSPWGNTARVLSSIYGPCWLAAETAIIGAALPHDKFTTGVDITRDSEPLGPAADYGRLLRDVRFNRAKADWWAGQFAAHEDPLSRATWALALVAVASAEIVLDNLASLGTATEQLPEPMLDALLAGSSRLGASGLARGLDGNVLAEAVGISPATGLLVAHYVAGLDRPTDLPQYSEAQLSELNRYGMSAWPGLRALTARMTAKPSSSLLAALRAFGATATLPPLGLRSGAEKHARSILENPAEYPLAAVLAAEQRVSQSGGDVPLEKVAQQDQWFTL
jgi:hypothetical protein